MRGLRSTRGRAIIAAAVSAMALATALAGPAGAAQNDSGKLPMTKTNKIDCDGTTSPGAASKSSAVIKLTGGDDGKVVAEVTINDAAKKADYDVKIVQSSETSSCGGGKKVTVKTDDEGDAKVTLSEKRESGRTSAFVIADGPGPILVSSTFDYDGD